MKKWFKGRIRPLPLIILVILVGVIITALWFFSSENLDPAEEIALRFVESAYVHPNPEKLRPLVSEENIDVSIYTDTSYILPGEVKVGSREDLRFKYVIVFIPLVPC